MSKYQTVLPIESAARFPVVGDNAAIALRDLSKGMQLQHGDAVITLQHDILTGHRFTTERIDEWHFHHLLELPVWHCRPRDRSR